MNRHIWRIWNVYEGTVTLVGMRRAWEGKRGPPFLVAIKFPISLGRVKVAGEGCHTCVLLLESFLRIFKELFCGSWGGGRNLQGGSSFKASSFRHDRAQFKLKRDRSLAILEAF